MASDFKYMLAGKARICFTEVLVGLPLPGSFIDKIKQTVLPPYFVEVCTGANFKAGQAKEIGLINEIAADREALRKLTTKRLDYLFKIPLAALRATKNHMNREIIDNLQRNGEIMLEIMKDETIFDNLLEAMHALKEKRRPNFK